MTNFENLKNRLIGLTNIEVTPEEAKKLYDERFFTTCKHCIYYSDRKTAESKCLDENNCNIGGAKYIQENIENIVKYLKVQDKNGKADMEIYDALENVFDFDCQQCSYDIEPNLCKTNECSEGHIKWLNEEIEKEE